MVNGIAFSSRIIYSYSDDVELVRQKTSEVIKKIVSETDALHEAMANSIDLALTKIQKNSDPFNRKLNFSFNKEIGRVVIKVMDSETNTVVRQVPPEQFIHLVEEIRKITGSVVDLKA